MCRKLLVVFFLCFLADGANSFAAGIVDIVGLYNRGNAAYRSGNFKKARQFYERAVSLGGKNGNLYYNLGNALLKQGKLGLARLCYERALCLIPRDDDLKKNLSMVISLLKDEQLSEKQSVVAEYLSEFHSFLSLGEWIVLADIFYFILSVFFILKLVFKIRHPFVKIALYFISFCLIAALVGLGGRAIKGLVPYGIVTEDTVEIKSAPDSSYPAMFKIHLGTKVIVREKRGEWILIKLPGRLSGWMSVNSMELI